MSELLEAVNFQEIATQIVEYLPNIGAAILLIFVFWIVAALVRRTAGAGLRRAKVSDPAASILQRFIRYVIVIIAAVTIADQLGINVASLVAAVGIAGLALSFAAQDTIANLISGVAIAIDRPFREGDWISLGDLHASVTSIRLRTTVLSTFDNETVVVPNQQLAQERVVNYTLTPRIRVRVGVGIAYKEDIDKARDVLLSTVQGDSRVQDEPAPVVLTKSLGESSVNLELRFWTEDANMKFPLEWEYTEKIKKALDAADIEIPFPHLQLFLEKTDAVSQLAGATR
jgi:small conductance mechanosensitive channel